MTDLPALDVGCLDFLATAVGRNDPRWILTRDLAFHFFHGTTDRLEARGLIKRSEFVITVTSLGLRLFPAVRDYVATKGAWQTHIKQAYAEHLEDLLAAILEGGRVAAPTRALGAELRAEAAAHRLKADEANGRAARSEREADEAERRLFAAAAARRPDFEFHDGRRPAPAVA